MPKVDRKNPKRSASSESSYSLMEFIKAFPDDDACLDWLWRTRFSPDGKTAYCAKCKQDRVFKHYATKQRRHSWTCTGCGRHVSVTAGTIFEGSATSLHLWFYAFYLMTSTRCGVSAKHLERELGVTYKTAWRMFNLIRNQLMTQDNEPLSGEVEVDEASVDGRPRPGQKHSLADDPEARSKAYKLRERSRATVLAAVERGGRIKATVVPSRRGRHIHDKVIEWVLPESIVYTDEWPAYNRLGQLYDHSRVRHTAREYVVGDVHTNTIEGFFGNLKTGIRGNYKKVSHRWLQGYLNEFCWRYNHRSDRHAMFESLILRAAVLPQDLA